MNTTNLSLLVAILSTLATLSDSMTISSISTGFWGSIGSLGGVRITILGSGFGTPFTRPTVEIGRAPQVADCVVVPYLSTETALVCDTTPSSTAVDARQERMHGTSGRRSDHEVIVKYHSTEAECFTTHAFGKCTIQISNEKVPTVSSLTSLSLRTLASGDMVTFRGDRLQHNDLESNLKISVGQYVCTNVSVETFFFFWRFFVSSRLFSLCVLCSLVLF